MFDTTPLFMYSDGLDSLVRVVGVDVNLPEHLTLEQVSTRKSKSTRYELAVLFKNLR
jgi:hypothetical protein